MKGNLENAIKLTFGSEGGYVNHPRDPGGPTKYGITLATLQNYRNDRSLDAEDVKHLSLTEAAAILEQGYWRKIWGDDLPKGVDYALFDYAVNSGPGQAIKKAQEIVGMDRDGVMGAFTLNAIKAMEPEVFIRAYMAARLKFLKGLDTWGTFGKGWESRITHVRLASLAMLEKSPKVIAEKAKPKEEPLPTLDGNATAPPRDTRITATPQGQAGITTTIGSITGAVVAGGSFLLPYADNPHVKLGLIGLAAACTAITIIGAVVGVIIQRRHIAEGNLI
jgi:lysozyme family protein